jgi:REP element-mobilizing transposase RayT
MERGVTRPSCHPIQATRPRRLFPRALGSVPQSHRHLRYRADDVVHLRPSGRAPRPRMIGRSRLRLPARDASLPRHFPRQRKRRSSVRSAIARPFSSSSESPQAGFNWSVTAWTLMTNHCHLFIRMTEPNLSRGMHWRNSLTSTGSTASMSDAGIRSRPFQRNPHRRRGVSRRCVALRRFQSRTREGRSTHRCIAASPLTSLLVNARAGCRSEVGQFEDHNSRTTSRGAY